MTRRRLRLAVTLGTTLVLAILAGGTVLVLNRTWTTAHRAAEENLQRTAQVVQTTINRQLLQVDSALASLPAVLAGAAGGAGQGSPEAASRVLAAFNFQTHAFRDLLLARPDGTVWATAKPRRKNQPAPIQAGELSHRSPGAVAVNGPVHNPVTGEWALFLARPVFVPGPGALSAIAEVPLASLTALLAEAGGGLPGVRITLERQDGLLIASVPHDEINTGKRQTGAIGGLGSDGRAFTVPAGDGRPAVIAAVRPTLYGDIVVTVALDAATAMANWTRDLNRLLGALALATLIIIASAGALDVALHRQEVLEAERVKARRQLEEAIEAMSDGFVMWDQDDRLVACNDRYRELYAESAPFIRPGAHFEDIIWEGARRGQYPQAGDDLDGFVREIVAWHRAGNGSLERLLPDGRWLLITERRIASGGIVGIRTDITALKGALDELAAANACAGQAMAEVEQQNRFFDAALGNMSHGLLMADPDQRVIVCNRRFLALFGLGEADVAPGMAIEEVFRAVRAAGACDAPAAERIEAEQRAIAEALRPGSFKVAGAGGRTLAIAQQPMDDGGWVAIYEDVTEQQGAEDRIRHLAHHDALTGLPNRVLFRECLETLLAEPGPAGRVAVLCLDLDGFKNVNDTLGHPIGDELLRAVAHRLREAAGEADVVARLGGDEFALAYSGADDPAALEAIGQRIVAALSAPFEIERHHVAIGASIGIAHRRAEAEHRAGEDADEMLRNADLALYHSKAEGRGHYSFFAEEMNARLQARLNLELDLRSALDQGQFELFFQPLVDAAECRASAFEALLRWHHPGRGMVSPAEFIPLAEETGLIKGIGRWVLERACLEAATWPGDLKVAVNLSPVQFRSSFLAADVVRALAVSGLAPERLELEITESVLLQDDASVLATLHEIRQLGVRIALDDFGTGYSSLSYLRRFPFDKIKIDRSFVQDIGEEGNIAIVRAVVRLGQALEIGVTAEGVETAEQIEILQREGCSELQGYVFSPPRPASQVPELIDRLSRRAAAA